MWEQSGWRSGFYKRTIAIFLAFRTYRNLLFIKIVAYGFLLLPFLLVRQLHSAVPVFYLELLFFHFERQRTVAEIPLRFLPDLLLTIAVHRQAYEGLR